jgi:hypothetical protein
MLAFALLLLGGLSVSAQGKKDAPKADTKMQAMMEAYMKHATPGEGHKKLQPLIGSWTYSGKFWMDPAAPPVEGTGTAERKWILDGRYLSEVVKGQMPGMGPFEGHGLWGYDNHTKKYFGLWIDSMTTSVTISQVNMDSAGKVLTGEHEDFDPALGQKIKAKDVLRIDSPNKQTLVSYRVEGGKETKMMELTLTRVK